MILKILQNCVSIIVATEKFINSTTGAPGTIHQPIIQMIGRWQMDIFVIRMFQRLLTPVGDNAENL